MTKRIFFALLGAGLLLLSGCGKAAESSTAAEESSRQVKIEDTVPEQVPRKAESAETEQSAEKTDGYLFPTDTQVLSTELEGLTSEELMLARNEIYARHGYVFTDQELKAYFESKSWYTPDASYDPQVADGLTDTERWNLENISFLENRRQNEPSQQTGTFSPSPEGLYTVTIPESWAGNYVCVTQGNEDGEVWTRFYSAPDYYSFLGGHVFSLVLTTGDYSFYPSYRYLGELTAEGVTRHLVAVYPTDVQFDTEKEENREIYRLLSGDTERIELSIASTEKAEFQRAG